MAFSINYRNDTTPKIIQSYKKRRRRAAQNRIKKYRKLQSNAGSKQRLIYQIAKAIKHHFPDLLERLEALPDPRKRGRYDLRELLMGCIMMYIFKSGSRNSHNQNRKTEKFKKNYERLFGIRLPHMDTVDKVLRQINPPELEGLKRLLLKDLFTRRVLHKFRLFGKYFTISVDATGYASFGRAPYEGCPFRTSKKGKKTYIQPVLEAKLVGKNGFSLSIATEWILLSLIHI